MIKVTLLSASPLPDSSQSLLPGVKFDPEGLQFALPATLTLDFNATPQVIINKDSIFLLTSPVTTLPLFGTANPGGKILTAQLFHFSTINWGNVRAALADIGSWINTIGLNTAVSLTELTTQVALVQVYQNVPCPPLISCPSVHSVLDRAISLFNTLINATCATSTTNPSDSALQQYIQLDALAQALGADRTVMRTCEQAVLRALIIRDGLRALQSPTDANLIRLNGRSSLAEQLGFDDLETLAAQKLDEVLRGLLAKGQDACGTDQVAGRTLLSTVQSFAPDVASVDGNLIIDVQQAISNCGGGLKRFYSGTFQDFYDNPLQALFDPAPADLSVIAQSGNEADLALDLFSGCGGSTSVFAHVTVSGASIQGQITRGQVHTCNGFLVNFNAYNGKNITFTINTDGSLSGRFDQQVQCTDFDPNTGECTQLRTRYYDLHLRP